MPSITTVQTPQVARLQLRTVPVSPIFSEITSHSVVRASCSTVWARAVEIEGRRHRGDGLRQRRPPTWRPVASTLRRNGDTTAGAATAPPTMPVATLALMKFLRVNFAMRFPSRAPDLRPARRLALDARAYGILARLQHGPNTMM